MTTKRTGTRADPPLDPRVVRSRAVVLDTAAQLVRERGLAAVTIDALVERSGVARSTIYRHWASRADVVVAALEHMLATASDPTSGEEPGGSAPSSLQERLVAVLSGFTGPSTSDQPIGLVPLVLVEAGRDPELAGFRERIVERLWGPLAEVLTAARADGSLHPEVSVDDAVVWLLGPVVVRRFTSPAGVDAAFVERTVAAFVRAHATGG